MKKTVVLVIALLMVFSLSVLAYSGDKQLQLQSSSIQDGAKDVSLTPEFKLEFTNNVVNMKVKEGNISAIKMLNMNKEPVNIEVEMADDQIKPEEKRVVLVKVKEALDSGEKYTLVIDKSFSSKNGTSLGKDINFNFTTEESTSINMLNIVGIGLVVVITIVIVFRKRKNEQSKY